MKKLLTIFCLLLIFTIFENPAFGSGKKKLYRTNVKAMYNEENPNSFEAVIYHETNEHSRVYVEINLKALTYLKHKYKDKHLARLGLRYDLYPNYESKEILDSAAYFYTDTANYSLEANMVVDFLIKSAFPGEYVLKLTLTDFNRQENGTTFRFYKVSKLDNHSAQNYLILDDSDIPLFKKNLNEDEFFKVTCNQKDPGQLLVRYYNRTLPIAKTPFSVEKNFTFRFKADSLYNVSMVNGETVLLRLPFKGIYHFQTDTAQTEGITLFHFDEGFPEIETPLQAILPLRYLTTQKEYDALLGYPDHKIAIDSFWLVRASNKPERAKNMIARYYQRVVLANRMFTSYQEGWKTDRGIVYIIYGPPTEVYRKTGQEQWIYGESGNPLNINFYFNEVENPFTFNDYSLQRSVDYKSGWYIAVENWRR